MPFEYRHLSLSVTIMSKKKTNLNLRNPKQLDLIYTFAISEGRLSKDSIMEIGNKELFYRMKNNGFIKETAKGSNVFKATLKLQKLTEQTTGISYSNGCSSKHSAKIGKALTFIPQETISEGRFSTGQMLKREMSAYKQTSSYERVIRKLQTNILHQEKQLQNDYQAYLSGNITNTERYQAEIDYQADSSYLQMQKDVAFSDTPLFIPDFSITTSHEETEQILQHMTDYLEHLPVESKEVVFLEQNITKLTEILQTEQTSYDLYLEIVTDSYGRVELERHHNYETIMNREVLYIY